MNVLDFCTIKRVRKGEYQWFTTLSIGQGDHFGTVAARSLPEARRLVKEIVQLKRARQASYAAVIERWGPR